MQRFPWKVSGDGLNFLYSIFFFVSKHRQDNLIILSELKQLLFDIEKANLKPTAVQLLRLPVAQKSLACGCAALTVALGQLLPFCGPTTFLLFKASSALPGLL